MKGFTPFTKDKSRFREKIDEWKTKRREKRSERVGERIRTREDRGKDTKRLEDKRFNIDNPWWKAKERELNELGGRSENKPYWQDSYQKEMAKQGKTTSGYLDAKYRRRGIPSYAPGAELHGPLGGVNQSSTSMSREESLMNKDIRDYI